MVSLSYFAPISLRKVSLRNVSLAVSTLPIVLCFLAGLVLGSMAWRFSTALKSPLSN